MSVDIDDILLTIEKYWKFIVYLQVTYTIDI